MNEMISIIIVVCLFSSNLAWIAILIKLYERYKDQQRELNHYKHLDIIKELEDEVQELHTQ